MPLKADRYGILRDFVERITREPAFDDPENSVQNALYHALNAVLDIETCGLSYALLYNTSENDRFGIVDFHGKDDSRVMDFIRAAAVSLLYNSRNMAFPKEDITEVRTAYLPKSLLSFPLANQGSIFGYVMLFSDSPSGLTDFSEEDIGFADTLFSLFALYKQRAYFEQSLEYVSLNDNMTDLPNRSFFYEAVVNSIQESTLLDTQFALLIIHINGLKNINNSLGFHIGDLLMREMARRLKISLREHNALTGKFNEGDFAVLVRLSAHDEAHIRNFCRIIFDQVKEPIQIEDYMLYITIGIGVSIFPKNGDTVETLMRRADEAKIAAKTMGNNDFVLYEDTMSTSTQKTLFLNNNLPMAMENDQFALFYQGQMDIKTKKITKVEALIRWMHPEQGIIPPSEFIPFAEENNFCIAIDDIVLRKACQQIREWKNRGLDIKVSVNISAKHFANGLILTTLARVFEEYSDISPSMLQIELLEGTLLENFETTVQVMKEMHKFGVTLALDDFGAGYSSLEYITTLPVDILKIDRSFTMNLFENPHNKVVLKTIVALAQDMNMVVLAEGVENRAQLDFLQSVGCDYAQGYLINRPAPPDEMEALIRKYLDKSPL